jgi:hypothetical protein
MARRVSRIAAQLAMQFASGHSGAACSGKVRHEPKVTILAFSSKAPNKWSESARIAMPWYHIPNDCMGAS